jgi:F0F1-type ATP synthase beta subunit
LKEELYEIGITEMKTLYGNKVKVYDLERTICDIIRNKKKIEIALFTDAMKRFVKRKDRNSIKLHKYAKMFNIEDELRKYLELLL